MAAHVSVGGFAAERELGGFSVCGKNRSRSSKISIQVIPRSILQVHGLQSTHLNRCLRQDCVGVLQRQYECDVT